MKIFIRMKSAGKRRPVLDDMLYEIPDTVSTLRELLTALVQTEVNAYNEKGTDIQIIPFLSKEALDQQASVGKVGFGRIYSDRKADAAKAVECAIQACLDGLVRVFQNEDELEQLDEKIKIQEGDHFTLIRLTFLAGRMW